jgi:hypothetical protein
MPRSFGTESLEPVPTGVFWTTDVPEDLLNRMQLATPFNFPVLEDRLGFRVAGFLADAADREAIRPQVSLNQRSADPRVSRWNPDGVGVYLSNTQDVMLHLTRQDRARRIGIYLTPPLTRDEIIDVSSPDPSSVGTMVKGFARRALFIGWSALAGTESAVRSIEQRYGMANLAAIDPPPSLLVKQWKSDYALPPKCAIWRDKGRRPLTRIGQVTLKGSD